MLLRINYIWVCRGTSQDIKIPAKEFAAFQQNARRYADAPFYLWVESKRAYAGYILPPNVVVRFVEELAPEEIEALKDTSVFENKIDLLRLFVLKRSLDEDSRCIAVYSDFDIPDMNLYSKEFRGRIEKYSMAFAGSYYPEYIENKTKYWNIFETSQVLAFGKFKKTPIVPAPPTLAMQYTDGFISRTYVEHGKVLVGSFENGFISFSQNTTPILNEMIKCSLENIKNKNFDKDGRDVVYYSMAHVLDKWGRLEGNQEIKWENDVSGFYVQYCSGWRLDDVSTLVPEVSCSRLRKFFKKAIGC